MNAVLSDASVSGEHSWKPFVAEWLAGLFMGPVSADTVVSYRIGLAANFLDALAVEPGCKLGVLSMRGALATEASPVTVAHKLAVGFTLLFDGVGGPGTVSPYESAYVGESGRLFGVPAGAMDLLLRRLDLSTHRTFCEPPDHLSVELALLAKLMRGRSTCDAQASLLDDHLLVWVPSFAVRCRNADRTGFYAGAVDVMAAFLNAQRADLRFEQTATSKKGAVSCRSK